MRAAHVRQKVKNKSAVFGVRTQDSGSPGQGLMTVRAITAWVRGAHPGCIDCEIMFRRVMAAGGRKGRRLGSQIIVTPGAV